jgi:hypothetical protein
MTDLDPNMSLDAAVPKQSDYLAKEDVGEAGQNLTIAGFASENLAKDGKPPEVKTILKFVEEVKPMVLNNTNKNRLKASYPGLVTIGEFKGKQINVFHDPMVDFGGEIVGGIRLRPVPAPEYQGHEQNLDKPLDDIPF